MSPTIYKVHPRSAYVYSNFPISQICLVKETRYFSTTTWPQDETAPNDIMSALPDLAEILLKST